MEVQPGTGRGDRGRDSNAHQHLLGLATCCLGPQGSLEGAIWDLSREVGSPSQHLP